MKLRLVSRLLIRFGIAFLIVSSLFRIMHWAYADLLLLVGFVNIGVGYVFRFYLKQNKSVLDFIKLGLIESWALQGIIAFMDLPGYEILFASTTVCLVAWFIMGGPTSYLESQNFDKRSWLYKLTIPIMGLFILCTGIGVIFKIMHWLGADLYISIGMSGAAAWILFITIHLQKSSAFAHGDSIKPEENRRASADKENHKS